MGENCPFDTVSFGCTKVHVCQIFILPFSAKSLTTSMDKVLKVIYEEDKCKMF